MSWRTKKRNTLDGEARRLRNALYETHTRLPTDQQKKYVYQAIRDNFPEAHWYTMKEHLSWCSGKEKARRELMVKTCHHCATGTAHSSDLLQAIQHAEPRLLSSVGFIPGPAFATMSQWADEASVSVGTMADAIQHLTLVHMGLLQ